MMDYYIFIKIVFRKMLKLHLYTHTISISMKKQHTKWDIKYASNIWSKEPELYIFINLDNYIERT